MKIRLSYIIFALTLLFATESFSQVDRSIGRNPYRGMNKKKEEKRDMVKESVVYLTKQLKLDTFQEAAIREIIIEHKDEMTAIMEDQKMRPQERKDKSFAISYKIYEKAAPLLSKEQIEAYKKMLNIEKEEIVEE